MFQDRFQNNAMRGPPSGSYCVHHPFKRWRVIKKWCHGLPVSAGEWVMSWALWFYSEQHKASDIKISIANSIDKTEDLLQVLSLDGSRSGNRHGVLILCGISIKVAENHQMKYSWEILESAQILPQNTEVDTKLKREDTDLADHTPTLFCWLESMTIQSWDYSYTIFLISLI